MIPSLKRLQNSVENNDPKWAIKKIIRNPLNLRYLKYLFKPGSRHFYEREISIDNQNFTAFINEITGASEEEISSARSELHSDKGFDESLNQKLLKTFERPLIKKGNWRELVYVLIRLEKPGTVLETGVYDGLSSAYILKALEKNGKGRLLSVENMEWDQPGDIDREFGWLVTPDLRDRWELIHGDVEEVLGDVAEENSVDFFLQDSNYSHECKVLEWEIALEHMGEADIIFSDDIDLSPAFRRYSENLESRATITKNRRNGRKVGKAGAGKIK